MHQLDITPVPVQTIDLILPVFLVGSAGAAVPAAVEATAAHAPGVVAIRHTSVTAVCATGTLAAIVPKPRDGTVFAAVATASALAKAVVAQNAVQARAVKAAASSAAAAPVVTGVVLGTVNAIAATASSTARIPAIGGGVNGDVFAVVATSTAAAITPVGPTQNATVNAVVAKTNVTVPSKALPPSVGGEIAVSGGGPGSASSLANPPSSVSGSGAGSGATFPFTFSATI